MPQLAQINVYPIKSCGRIERRSEVVGERGLAGDRRYMLVDAAGRFMTARQHPRMTLIRLRDDEHGGYVAEAPGLKPLCLPREWSEGPALDVVVWRCELEATAAAEDVSAWFAKFLGLDCRLVFMADHQHRAVPNAAAAFDDQVSFADAAPLLLTTDASLAELGSRLGRPVSMRRFRPNLVVTADRPFAEDGWRYLRIGEAEFEVGWPSSRCVLTTIDPDTGSKDPHGEPLRTLREFRRFPGGVLFGQNLLPRRLGRISVGDEVEVQ